MRGDPLSNELVKGIPDVSKGFLVDGEAKGVSESGEKREDGSKNEGKNEGFLVVSKKVKEEKEEEN